MTRIAYVNGAYVPQHLAQVMMEDRGYQFADGVYEVAAFMNRRMLDLGLHLDRLERSLNEIQIPMPMTRAALTCQLYEIIRRNAKQSGLVYLQITRGTAARQHTIPTGLKPVLTMSVLPVNIATSAMREAGAKALTTPDLRWKRCDIKSIALLPNILGRALSQAKNMRETFFYNEQEEMTEGSATNLFMVDEKDMLHTHPKTHAILPGVTRDVVVNLAKENGITVVEKAFSKQNMYQAKELFFTSTSTFLMPVIEVDGKRIAHGKMGEVTRKLIGLYEAHVKKETA